VPSNAEFSRHLQIIILRSTLRDDVLNSDMLLMYDQDDLLQLALVVKEKLAGLEILYHFAHEVSEYQ
jgi:hypothetical protein